MLNLVCQTCGIVFEWQNAFKKFCPLCIRLRRAEYQKVYSQTEDGKAIKAWHTQTEAGKATRARQRASPGTKATTVKYQASSEGKATRAKYAASPEGRTTQRRWLKSDKGKASVQAMNAKARSGQDYYQYLAFKNEAFRDQLPCIKCGTPWQDGPRGVTHEVDHIIPRALGGTHNRDNLQVLCYTCHLTKTLSERKGIAEAKKTLQVGVKT